MPPTVPAADLEIVRIRETCRISGLPKSSVYAEVKAGTFPAPIPLSRRRVGWLRTEIETWIKHKIEARERRSRTPVRRRRRLQHEQDAADA
jgi:prophage regulatory protein